ncbi:DUF2975 domain-containing protein [Serratia marcescens]|uniref:DUF2975 domain-containing protein n=1 Tax=Serratia marcescens TaxID=615 RepID=UPI0013D9A27B|nr:DUF2975 domain-containing protein [Serratia marcescens]
MELALLIGLISTPILGQVFAWLQTGNDVSVLGGVIHKECEMLPGSYLNAAASAICNFLRDCIFSLMFWHFYKVFRDIRAGAVFNQKQIKRISISGWCFIVLSIYSIISDMYLSLLQSSEENPQYYFQIDNLTYIPIGVGLVILSYVLQLATEIKEEQELVI